MMIPIPLLEMKLVPLSTDELEKRTGKLLADLTEYHKKYKEYLETLKNLNSQLALKKLPFEQIEEEFNSVLSEKEVHDLSFADSINFLLSDYNKIYSYISKSKIDVIKNKIDTLEKDASLEEKIQSVTNPNTQSMHYAKLQREIQEQQKLLTKIESGTAEYSHIYTPEYIEILERILPVANEELQAFRETEKLIKDEISSFEKKMEAAKDELENRINRNNLMSSWGVCIEKIQEHISKMENEEHTALMFSASYLLHLVLTGKISFRLKTKNSSRNQFPYSKAYSFIDVYNEFISNIGDGIHFDELSPQYLPRGTGQERILCDNFKQNPKSITKDSSSFIDGIIAETKFILVDKPKNMQDAKENWVFSLPREYTFSVEQLPMLVPFDYEGYCGLVEEDETLSLQHVCDELELLKPYMKSAILRFDKEFPKSVIKKDFFKAYKQFIDNVVNLSINVNEKVSHVRMKF